MLALCDSDGFVHTSRVGLRQACAVTDEELTAALAALEGPDPDSRTSDSGGRRIERVEGGWTVLNYAQYRDRTTDAKAKAAERQRKYRAKQKGQASRNVTRQTGRRDSPKAEAEGKAEGEAEGEAKISHLASARPAHEAARYLYDAIESHTPSHMGAIPPAKISKRLDGWAVHCDRAMRLDGRSLDDLKRAIDYAHRSPDHFWRPNLLSGAKLRKHLPKLLIKAKSAARGKVGKPAPVIDISTFDAGAALMGGRFDD